MFLFLCRRKCGFHGSWGDSAPFAIAYSVIIIITIKQGQFITHHSASARARLAHAGRGHPHALSTSFRIAYSYTQSNQIRNPHKATHRQGEVDPSATSRVANPASHSDAGLGGWKAQL